MFKMLLTRSQKKYLAEFVQFSIRLHEQWKISQQGEKSREILSFVFSQ